MDQTVSTKETKKGFRKTKFLLPMAAGVAATLLAQSFSPEASRTDDSLLLNHRDTAYREALSRKEESMTAVSAYFYYVTDMFGLPVKRAIAETYLRGMGDIYLKSGLEYVREGQRGVALSLFETAADLGNIEGAQNMVVLTDELSQKGEISVNAEMALARSAQTMDRVEHSLNTGDAYPVADVYVKKILEGGIGAGQEAIQNNTTDAVNGGWLQTPVEGVVKIGADRVAAGETLYGQLMVEEGLNRGAKDQDASVVQALSKEKPEVVPPHLVSGIWDYAAKAIATAPAGVAIEYCDVFEKARGVYMESGSYVVQPSFFRPSFIKSVSVDVSAADAAKMTAIFNKAEAACQPFEPHTLGPIDNADIILPPPVPR